MRADRAMRATNPVPEERGGPLTDRAVRELRALVGDAPPGASPAPRRAAARRPRLALAVGAVGVVALGAAVVAALLPDPAPPAADEPFYASGSELESRADVIVRGTVVTTQETQRDGYPQTVGTLDVVAVAAGDVAPGDRLSASWVTPGATALSDDAPQVGGEYVLLLVDVDGELVLVSQTQGWYTVSDAAAVPGEGNPVALTGPTLTDLGLG